MFDYTLTNTTAITEDSSKAVGGATVYGTQLGSNVTGDLSGATLYMTDPGAIAAGQAIAQQALAGNQAATLAFAGDVQYALGRVMDLAQVSQQGEGGTIMRGVTWIFGIGIAALLLWWFVGIPPKKKKEGE